MTARRQHAAERLGRTGLLSRGAASPAVSQSLRAALVDAGMALLNASKTADARRPTVKVTP